MYVCKTIDSEVVVVCDIFVGHHRYSYVVLECRTSEYAYDTIEFDLAIVPTYIDNYDDIIDR